MNAGTATVTITPDLRGLQMLGDAARAVELAGQECASVGTAFETWTDTQERWEAGEGERTALINLVACCLARLHEIR